MSEVFKARFDGREWWAVEDPASYVNLVALAAFKSRPEFMRWIADNPEPTVNDIDYTVPAHMVERIEELPPEPPVGTVLWDERDQPWAREDEGPSNEEEGPSNWWSPVVKQWLTWAEIQQCGPPHPYPRAARDEIKQLTAERDEARHQRAVQAANAESRLQSAMAASERAEQLQARIDAATEWCNQFPGLARILRGES